MAVLKASEVTLEDIILEYGLVKKERLQETCSPQVNLANELKDWELVGRCLDMPLDELSAIGRENATEHQRMIAVLNLWYKREGRSATYWRLAEAFYRRGHHDLIQSLCTCLSEHDKEWSRHIDEYWTPEQSAAAVAESAPEREPSPEPHDDKDQAVVYRPQPISVPDSELTPEYRSFSQYSYEIMLAVKDELNTIAKMLESSKLITPDQCEIVGNSDNGPLDSRAATLVGYVQRKVKQNTQHFHTFTDVLKSAPGQYGDILGQLMNFDSLGHAPCGISPLQVTEGTRLHNKDHSNICYKLEPHATKWWDIGSALGFKDRELDYIMSTPWLLEQAPKSWLRQMLTQWLEWAPGDGRGSTGFATKEALRGALLQANLGVVAQQF